ncbi:hypothetical protein ATY76_06995 [Rhizobium sp. R339]|uniref:type II toxin -antitoxin system TacA 1-like antitoxin n=1 Tax=Rhizobium sp. R339 TaxID=1764273 RepID=UPI000B75B3CF|nr:DUF1778 domain-containing protein [Rhizobium sp. R339]OWV72561.1 hypothetical protein ATY76_06995 [Rhizobium sp. R339]
MAGAAMGIDMSIFLRLFASDFITCNVLTFDEEPMADTELMRRAAMDESQTAILNESVIRLHPDDFESFVVRIEAAPSEPPPKAAERLRRKAPWEK